MTREHCASIVAAALCVFIATNAAAQQLTTATLSGSATDPQGAQIPGVSVVLRSETRGLALPVVVTDERGEFLIPNIPPDRYTLEVELSGFKPLRRTGIVLSGGDRHTVGALRLELGGVTDTIVVTAAQTFIQAESGERSFTVDTDSVASLPIANRSFTSLIELAPGVSGTNRIGGGGQPNIMMDGVSTMDPGAGNRASLQMNVESIAEVKVVTSSYQAEYGRSAGIQVMAVTKAGTNQFHGAVYDVERKSKWNSNSKANILNNVPKNQFAEREWGFSIGGPIGKPGGDNKVFFFYAQEFAPRSRGNDTQRFRLPTSAERNGDFSKSIDQNGTPYNLIRDALTNLPCSTTDTRGCFADGGVLGKIPQNRLYPLGLNILKLYPLPNVEVPGAAYNYEFVRPNESIRATQPAIKIDYQPTANVRLGGKYSAWRQQEKPVLGSLPGFNDTIMSHPVVDTWAANLNYTLTPTVFLEATYGRAQLEFVGCAPAQNGSAPVFCQTALPVNPVANSVTSGLTGLPLLFPDAGILSPDTRMAWLLSRISSPIYQNGRVEVLPNFAWGNRITNAPPNIPLPNGGAMNAVLNEDFNASLTMVHGQHTIKTGIYYAHNTKVQQASPGNSAGSFRGSYSFANDSTNPFDTTFGYANAATGVFSSFQQASKIAEGKNGFYNLEGYVQDTWRFNPRLTLDYGLRLIHQVPQHDEANQSSNFLPETWAPGSAPLLYKAGCVVATNPCPAASRQARHPVTGAFLGSGSTLYIGTIVPDSGDLLNGMRFGGEGIHEYGVDAPALGAAPRAGFAYDLMGNQKLIVRGGAGLFLARGFLNATAANPPFVQDVTVRNNFVTALTASGGTAAIVPPQLAANEYRMPNPSDVQWSGGAQMTLPASMALDVAYVGHHSWNEINNTNANMVDFGVAYLPANQDPTLSQNVALGSAAVSRAELSSYRGYGIIEMTLTNGWRTFHSIQTSLNRRFNRGLQFGLNHTWNLYERSHVAPRFEHGPDGSLQFRADQAEAERLLGNPNPIQHTFKGNFVWDLPDLQVENQIGRIAGLILNDWQLSGIWTATSGASYSVGFNYNSNGTNQNLTGSPDYGARILIVGEPGAGCSDDPLRQFNTAAFAGPQPQSVGLESGQGYLRGCFRNTLDLSIARTIRLGGGRSLQLRADVFNAPNSADITGRNSNMGIASPATATVATNLPFDEAGNVIDARSRPQGAGFGVANAYQPPRTVQLQVRFAF